MHKLDWVRAVALACLARACYEATRQRPKPLQESSQTQPQGGCNCNLTNSEDGASLKPEPPPDLPPQVREWKRKELRRYREAQEKKWRNWFDAIFERK